ncbi:MAG: hypothetical protein KGL44_00780 [Sphingomonadales bacterium]|nr:hypothetical protein [Sphingomonadales bacterium]
MAGRQPFGALVATAALAGALVLAGAGSALGEIDPAAGAALAPWDSELHESLALRAFAANRSAQAGHHARRALAAMPFGQPSLTILSLQGDARQRLDGLNQSAALGWRDVLTDMRLVSAAFANGDPVVAAQRIDAFGRTAGGKAVTVPADRLLTMKGGVEALAERAAHHSDNGWLPEYLDQPARTPELVAARTALMQRLDRDDGDWRWLAIVHAIKGIADGGHSDAAFDLWRSTLADPGQWGRGIYDPEFRLFGTSRMATGGDWQVPGEPLLTAERRDEGGLHLAWQPGPAGLALFQTVRPTGGPVDLRIVWHGTASPEPDFAWQLQCLDGGLVPLQRTVTAVTGGWEERYTGPAPSCPVALLMLQRRSTGSTGEAVIRSVGFGPAA